MTSDGVVSFIGTAGFVSIIILATVRTIIDIADAFEFLPRKIENYLRRKRKRQIVEVLELVGIMPHRTALQAAARELNIGRSELLSREDAERDVDTLISRSIEQGNYKIGETTESDVVCFLNLRKVVLSKDLWHLATAFASWIADYCEREDIRFDLIVAPAGTTVPLTLCVAQLLNVPTLFHDLETKTTVGDKKYCFVGDTVAPSFEGKTAIIVDESAMSGRQLSDTWTAAVQHLKVKCDHAFIIFKRSEGNIKRYTAYSKAVQTHWIRGYSDADLVRLLSHDAALRKGKE